MTIRRALILALAAASAVFIAVQLNDGWGRIRDEPLPGVLPIVGVVALLALGQVALGEAMVALGAGGTTPFDRRWAFHISQPAKYVPIGVAHAAGSVTALTGRGAARVTAGVLWAVHTGTLVIGELSIRDLRTRIRFASGSAERSPFEVEIAELRFDEVGSDGPKLLVGGRFLQLLVGGLVRAVLAKGDRLPGLLARDLAEQVASLGALWPFARRASESPSGRS